MQAIHSRLPEDVVEELGSAMTKAFEIHGRPKDDVLAGTILRSILSVLERKRLLVLASVKLISD